MNEARTPRKDPDGQLPRCAMTLADVFVAVGLAASVNDVRLACGMGCVAIDDVKVRTWDKLVDPVSLGGKKLRFIARESRLSRLQMSLLSPPLT